MKKWLDAIWEPFDSEDSMEWFLLLFGWTALGVGAIWTILQ